MSQFSSESVVGHIPVLVKPIVESLAPKPGETMIDCTVGRGGHALAIIPFLGPTGRYIGLDVDPQNLAFAKQRLADANCKVDLIQSNFTHLPAVVQELAPEGADMLLADLGFSSNQMDDPQRGFSFQSDGPLDMRLDPHLPTTAADLVNQLSERELADLIYQFGEDRLSRRIARRIVDHRRQQPILSTSHLARLVASAYPHSQVHQRIHPATRTFMALRIAVNEELQALACLLDCLPKAVKPNGRAGIISFHSLEDRMVKQAFQKLAKQDQAQILTKKPITADEGEQAENPRSRSAKYRCIRLICSD